MKRKPIPPVLSEKCATCPFQVGSPYAHLALHLAEQAISHNSRICHSTGNNAINRKTGKPERLCRGARDIQLKVYHRHGILEAPTDEAWEKAWNEMKKAKGIES